ncbi:MAG: hypothetical protein AAB263_01915 [Planctomycetota bacterium]
MNIYFCDECGARVSGLDLRAGKGMRSGYDIICSSCVEQGHAARWLASKQSQRGKAVVAAAAAGSGRAPVASASAVAVVESPSLIDVARDRAQTAPDDPFIVEEPPPLAPLRQPSKPVAPPAVQPSRQTETDAIPTKQPKAKSVSPMDGLAAAGGGFGALAGAGGSSKSGPDLIDDEPAEASANPFSDSSTSDDPVQVPEPESPFQRPSGRRAAATSGKSTTEEVEATDVDPAPKRSSDSSQSRSASGRQGSQRRGGTSAAKRPASKSSRRSTNPLQSKKMLLISLAACTCVALLFLFVRGMGSGSKTQVIENFAPLNVLQESVNRANKLSKDYENNFQNKDVGKLKEAKQAIDDLMQAMQAFEREVKKSKDAAKWGDDELGQQYHNMDIELIKSRRKAISDYLFRLEMEKR